MENGSGGRSRRNEFGDETNGPSAGLTLGGILSIKQTPPYRIQARTLLDLIRDDRTCGRESKRTWKMFREKLRLKLAGSGCTTAAPAILASHVQINSGYGTDGNRMTTESSTNGVISISPLVNVNMNVNDASSVADTQSGNVQQTEVQNLQVAVAERDGIALAEEGGGGGGGGGGPAAARMSLMSLLEGDGYAYLDDNEEDEAAAEEEEDAAAVGGGGGGGGGEYKYNNCCVCMVRHKGAAFIPCGHTFCRLCSRELFVKRASCPLCNHFILEILDIF